MKIRDPEIDQTSIGVKSAGGKRLCLAMAIFVLICLETLYALPYRSIYLLRHSVTQAALAGLITLTMICAGFVLRTSVLQMLGRLARLTSAGNRTWLAFWLIVGLCLRLAWILKFPTPPKSDHLAYFQIATSMAQGHTGNGAFWPPGFPLFLAPFFAMFGAHLWVAHLCALLLFMATYLLTYALAEQALGGLASRIAPMLIAVWPGYFTMAGINCKEGLLAVLVPATVLLVWKSSSQTPQSADCHAKVRWGLLFAAGVCMGLASLTQPGYMLFPLVVFAIETLRGTKIVGSIGHTIVFSIALVVTILPWTYRNYLVFHRIVAVSTNGGSVFYRANNPLADANYSAEGEIPLPKDEFAADKIGYQLADEWIKQHPIAFASLMVRKQLVFLGDDALGAYETLKRDQHPGRFYSVIKAISNLFWLAVWAVLLYGVAYLFGLRNWQMWFGMLFLPLLYQWAIDSAFESGPRHHLPYIALISVMAGMAVDLARRKSETVDETQLTQYSYRPA
jgi:4-amino-4-deoxy-L-arabinose transferase-like glycosyltransferase